MDPVCTLGMSVLYDCISIVTDVPKMSPYHLMNVYLPSQCRITILGFKNRFSLNLDLEKEGVTNSLAELA